MKTTALHSVDMVRVIRDAMYEETVGLPSEELRLYFQREAELGRKHRADEGARTPPRSSAAH